MKSIRKTNMLLLSALAVFIFSAGVNAEFVVNIWPGHRPAMGTGLILDLELESHDLYTYLVNNHIRVGDDGLWRRDINGVTYVRRPLPGEPLVPVTVMRDRFNRPVYRSNLLTLGPMIGDHQYFTDDEHILWIRELQGQTKKTLEYLFGYIPPEDVHYEKDQGRIKLKGVTEGVPFRIPHHQEVSFMLGAVYTFAMNVFDKTDRRPIVAILDDRVFMRTNKTTREGLIGAFRYDHEDPFAFPLGYSWARGYGPTKRPDLTKVNRYAGWDWEMALENHWTEIAKFENGGFVYKGTMYVVDELQNIASAPDFVPSFTPPVVHSILNPPANAGNVGSDATQEQLDAAWNAGYNEAQRDADAIIGAIYDDLLEKEQEVSDLKRENDSLERTTQALLEQIKDLSNTILGSKESESSQPVAFTQSPSPEELRNNSVHVLNSQQPEAENINAAGALTGNGHPNGTVGGGSDVFGGEQAPSNAVYSAVPRTPMVDRTATIISVRPSNVLLHITRSLDIEVEMSDANGTRRILHSIPISWNTSDSSGIDGRVFSEHVGEYVAVPLQFVTSDGQEVKGEWRFDSVGSLGGRL